MNKILVVIGMIAATGILYACGGSSGGGTTPGGGTTTTSVAAPTIAAAPTTITNETEAAKTVNASKTLAASFASGASFPSLNALVQKPADQTADGNKIIATVRDMQQRIAGIVEKQKALGKMVAAAESQPCTGGGSMSFDPAANPLTITFAACKEFDEYQNGTVTMPQSFMNTGGTASGSLSVNMTTISYAPGSGYSVKQFESALNMTMAFTSLDMTTGAMNLSMNGSQSLIDYVAGTSEKQSFGSFSLNMTETVGTSTTTSMTMNGAVSMDTFTGTTFSTIATASGMTFRNLVLTDVFDSITSTDTLTINGTYAIKTIPACMDGTFLISTQTPLTTTANGVTTGQMTVNGVVMVFNSDGTVTATINGTPQTITSYANVCSLSF